MIEKFSILKRGIGIESEKYANKLESVTIEQRDKQKINSKAFAIPILTASGL